MAALRVLVVDDEPDVCLALQSVLASGLPADVEIAVSGREARELFQAGVRFDLVLTDLRMPDGTGDELLAWLRHHHPGVARVLMSGSVQGRSAAGRGRAQAFLQKPLQAGTVLLALRGVLPEAHASPLQVNGGAARQRRRADGGADALVGVQDGVAGRDVAEDPAHRRKAGRSVHQARLDVL